MTTTTEHASDFKRAVAAGYGFAQHEETDYWGKVKTRWRWVSPTGPGLDGYATRKDAVADALRHRAGPWHRRIDAFARQVNLLDPKLHASQAIPFVVNLVRENGITSNDFWEMDERPGQFHIDGKSYTADGSQWHFRLRQARNDPASGLFEALRENSPGAS